MAKKITQKIFVFFFCSYKYGILAERKECKTQHGVYSVELTKVDCENCGINDLLKRSISKGLGNSSTDLIVLESVKYLFHDTMEQQNKKLYFFVKYIVLDELDEHKMLKYKFGIYTIIVDIHEDYTGFAIQDLLIMSIYKSVDVAWKNIQIKDCNYLFHAL